MSFYVAGFVLMASLGAYFRFESAQFFIAPWGTLLVNVVGSLLIGFLAVYLERFSPQARAVFLVAFLGSLTTFSSYSLEMIGLFDQGQYARAGLYFFLSNGLCLLGCLMGWKFAHYLVSIN
jgi:CrcB protein